jgi:transcription antitermination factor NusG
VKMAPSPAVINTLSRQGCRVRIDKGQLAGIEGVLARDPRGDKLIVSVELIHSSVAIHVNSDEVKPI